MTRAQIPTKPELGLTRGRLHLNRILIGALMILVIGATATLLGWDINAWLRHLSHDITSIPLGYLIAGIALITVQTTATAFAWYSILSYAYPDSAFSWLQVLAIYAAAVALNWVLPANLGTLACRDKEQPTSASGRARSATPSRSPQGRQATVVA
jgi:hypothetical protein